MTVAPAQGFVAPESAEKRNPDRFERARQGVEMGLAPDAVEDHPAELDVRAEGVESVNQRGDGSAHRGRIDHEHHRCIDCYRDGCGACESRRFDARCFRDRPRREVLRFLGQLERVRIRHPVEQAHHPFDHEKIGTLARARGKGRHRALAADPCVEVPTRSSRCEGVVSGVYEVRADLGRRDCLSASREGRHDAGGDGRLADP